MNYTLMHKDIPVVEITLDDGGTKITRVGELYHGEDLPVGVPITWDKADRAALNAWWTDRLIPSARSGLVDALSQLGFPNPQQVISRNLGLSLSDHYWVKPASSNLSWDEVNFFEKGFWSRAAFNRAHKAYSLRRTLSRFLFTSRFSPFSETEIPAVL